MYQIVSSFIQPDGGKVVRGRIYFDIEGNSNINPNLARHIQEDYKEPTPQELREFILPGLLAVGKGAEVLARSNWTIEEIVASARWSQKAGCTCGCSPGFIVEGMNHHNAFITLRYVQSFSIDENKVSKTVA